MKKIRIQRVSAFDVTVTLPLAVILGLLSVRGIGKLSKMQTATEDYIQCQTLARQLQSGSDYLVGQVRMYTATGQREYMDNYFENLNVTRRRETALEYFGENYGDTEAFTLLKSVMMTSQNLSCTHRYAMRLVAQATLVDFSAWPQEIQSVSLHDSDMAVADADKLRKAQQLVSNSQYQNTCDKITTINNQRSCPTDDLPAVSLSVGVAFTERANPGESIFKDADKALYHVKQNGKHGCGFY